MHFTGTHKKINSRLDKAIWENKMFKDNDNVLFAVSGGADSMALLDLLHERIHIYAKNLTLFAIYVDLGFGGKADQRCEAMKNHFEKYKISFQIDRTDIGNISHRPENRVNACFLCSRIKRKHIFECAEKNNCHRIIFAHHKDDVVETLLMNIIFSREISTMIPKLDVFNGRYSVLRPLVYIEEALIKNYVMQQSIPIISQDCPTDGESIRQYVKELVHKLEYDHQGSRENIFKSLRHVKNDYLWTKMPGQQ